MADEIAELIRDLGDIPKELRKELRPGLRAAAKPVLEQARRNAFWSTRIPKATRITVRFSGRMLGVSIITDAKKAPHARPHENQGRQGTFRHPVYGDRNVWVDQKARPYLYSALETKGAAAEKEIAEAVNRATRQAGFH